MIKTNKNNLIIGLILCFIVISCLIINCKYREHFIFETGICPKKPEITEVIIRDEELECDEIPNIESTSKEVEQITEQLVFDGIFTDNPPGDSFCNNVEDILTEIKDGKSVDNINDISDNDKTFLKKFVSDLFIKKLNDKFECIKNELVLLCQSDNDAEKLKNFINNSPCFKLTLLLNKIAEVSQDSQDSPTNTEEKKKIDTVIIKALGSSLVTNSEINILDLSKEIKEINTKIKSNIKIKTPTIPIITIKKMADMPTEQKEIILKAKFVDNTRQIRQQLTTSKEGQSILNSCKSNHVI